MNPLHEVLLWAMVGIIGAFAMVLSIVMFDVSASMLITPLVVFARISGPATQLQLGAQQIMDVLPAHEKGLELERGLVAIKSTAVTPSNGVTIIADSPIVFNRVSFSTTRRLQSTQPLGCAISA
jgi:hypothetical protein